jgi:multidrug efflux pump subunit AcrA (membrane-fusion protein)
MKFPLLLTFLACTLQTAFAAAIPVRIATVEQTAHAAERQIPGRIEAIHTVELRARTEGVITQTHFRDGQYVKKVMCCLNWTMPNRVPRCVWHRPR